MGLRAPRKRGLRAASTCLAAAALIAGCGGSDDKPAQNGTVQSDERGILGTVDLLQRASRTGDGRTICDQIFTAQLVRSIEAAANRSCPTEVRRSLFSKAATISVERGVKVDGATATAVIREQNGNVSTLSLLKQGGRWRINRVTAQ